MSSGNFLFLVLILMGPIVSMSSSSWVIVWVGIELSFLGLIPLLLSSNSSVSLNKESAMKYFCIQALGSGLLLCGGLLMFGRFSFSPMVMEIVFIFGLLLKLGVFPGHFWVPSVVAGLDWFVLGLLLTWMKVPPFLLLANLLENTPWISDVLLALGGLSAIVGALIGLNQTKVLPMLGASSISHSGWLVVGCVFGSVWTYFFMYSISFYLLCMCMSLENKLMASFSTLGMSGLPPFILFLGKWSVIQSCLGSEFSYWFLVLPLLGSVMSLYFYLKFFYALFMDGTKEEGLKFFFLSLFGVSVFLGIWGIFMI